MSAEKFGPCSKGIFSYSDYDNIPCTTVEYVGTCGHYPLGRTIKHETEAIQWSIKFRNGMVKRFTFKVKI